MMRKRIIDRVAERISRNSKETIPIDQAVSNPLPPRDSSFLEGLSVPRFDFGIVDVVRGVQTISFGRVFKEVPSVAANYSESRNGFLASVADRISLDNIKRVVFPRLQNFGDFLDRDLIRPWGDVWHDDIKKGCKDLRIPDFFCDPLAAIARFFGNQFFFLYYSGTGDFEVIGRAIAGKIYSDLQNRIDDLVFGGRGINTTIQAIESQVNARIDELQAKINAVPDQIMQTFGYTRDPAGRYSLPVPVTIRNITRTGFTVEVPQNGSIAYIAMG